MGDLRVTLNRDWDVVGGAWDASSAKRRIFDRFTNADGEFDAAGAADYFLLADPSTGEKGDLHLPVADIRDGESVIVASALRAVLSRVGQGFPEAASAEERERAADVARAKLAEFNDDRRDFAADSICVMLLLPNELASQFPDLGDHGPPHITLIRCQHGTMDQAMMVCDIVRGAHAAVAGQTLEVGGLGYFEHPDRRVAFSAVRVPQTVRDARDAMADLIRAGGLEVSRTNHVWKPHATLSMDSGKTYEGPVPFGEMVIRREDIAIMRGGQRIDTLRKTSEGWEVWTEDGSRKLDGPMSEEDARERLRQIEAAKAARSDARTDEEKAKIRSRWASGEGPNMGASAHREWMESPFSGPNRKSGAERDRARRVARRAQRVVAKSTEDWEAQDYTDALEIMGFIARHREQSGGEPIVIDGREGPSPNRAALMDWGFDPKIARRSDASQLGLTFEHHADGATTVHCPDGGWIRVGGAPAIHTEPKTADWILRADKIELGDRLTTVELQTRLDLADKAVEDLNGYVMYPAIFARGDNVQRYGSTLEFRPWDVVKQSIGEYPGLPFELRHSEDLLTPDTVAGSALGAIVTADAYEPEKDIRGLFRSWGRELTDSIERPRSQGGTPDVSMAYRVKVDRRAGRANGKRYDQRVLALVPNSGAAEPYGRAGTSKILARKDARPVGRRILLDFARGRRPIPAKPIYFDDRTDREDQNPMMMAKMIQALMDASGMTREMLAERLGMEAEALEMLMSGEAEMTDEQMTMLAAAMTGDRDDAMKPQDEADRRYEGDGELRRELESARAQLAEARGDRDKMRKDAAEMIPRADAAAATVDAIGTIADSWGLPRKDGEAPDDFAQRVATEGHDLIRQGSEAMHFVRLGLGSDHVIEPRKDADSGEDLPVTVRQMKREAIRASYGLMALTDEERKDAAAKCEADLDAIDKAPDAAIDYILDMKMAEAADRFDARDSKLADIKKAVNRAANNNAEADRKDGEKRENILRNATKAAADAARNGGHPEKVTG